MKLSALVGGAMTIVGPLSAWKCENCGNEAYHTSVEDKCCHLCGWPNPQYKLKSTWKCPWCETAVSTLVTVCSYCGLDRKSPGNKRTKFWDPDKPGAVPQPGGPSAPTLQRSPSEEEFARLNRQHALQEIARNVNTMLYNPADVELMNAEFARLGSPWRLAGGVE